MSSNEDESEEARPGREVAHRLFAGEFDDSSLSYAESDEERAPNYVISPTGARLNRVFVVGTLTEVTDVNEEMVRARVVDPTGAFVVYAGQYQPEALAFLERAEPPAFVAVTGKARTFEPDDGDQVYTSIRPETLATVDADTRERWVVDTAEHTLDRIRTYAAASELDATGTELTDVLESNGVSRGFAEGIPLARSHYGTTPSYLAQLRTVAAEAVRVVAGEQSQIDASVGSPDATNPDGPDFATLAGDGTVLSMPEDVETAATDATADEPAEAVDAETDAAAGAAVGTATATSTTETADTTAADSIEAADEPAARSGEAEPTEESGEATADAEGSATDVEAESGGPDSASDVDPAADSTSEPTANDESDDELGDFDVDDERDADTEETSEMDDATDETEEADEATDDLDESVDADDFEDGMYELDEEEREQIEAEYGTDFTTGAEVDDPGEADIDVPDPEDVMPEGADESAGDDDEGDADDASDGAEDSDVDLQARVVEAMDELDDGDGADRSAVVDAVADETGADEDAVEQAIQDALMGGECFEPSDGRLQAI